jgi:hypothetical protein
MRNDFRSNDFGQYIYRVDSITMQCREFRSQMLHVITNLSHIGRKFSMD